MSYENCKDEISAIMSDKSKMAEITADNKKIKHIRKLTDGDIKHFYKLNPVWFSYIDENLAEKPVPGFYAKEIATLYPSVATYNDDNAEDWSEKKLIPIMVKAIQQCHKRINELEREVNELRR